MTPPRTDARHAIVDAGARLLREGGPAAMTTRGVAELAGVQAPTIYRLFGDKDGLLEAVAEHVMAGFVAVKTAEMEATAADDLDPVADLRASWRRQVEFSLANPAVFRLLSDPDRVGGSPAAQSGREVLRSRVHRLATAGLLRVPEARAVDLIHASGVGVIHALLAMPGDQRDPALGETMMDAVLDAILVDAGSSADVAGHGPVAAAVSLRAVAPELEVLSPPERQLLAEWLDRIAAG
ncbi:DNA-binding transcriptional regulator, AcrR family [Nocardioides exalbidus]|uniref:DNA-binding transcriptional regulator, AcrR family n=1 Tax=Nocardioides exalbidus TaxID=402596 RepID=A0A1H4QC40_9ACTN|nr:TetR/AcrR family transcriptional regulator [Nocardioides exalbidus]SEC17215.1 DNA-binding transcriptional regulator, AcrR family [Nocardioides exalbidus]